MLSYHTALFLVRLLSGLPVLSVYILSSVAVLNRERIIPMKVSETRPQDYKTFPCSTQLSTKFQLLIKKLKYQQIKKYLALRPSDVVLIMLINVKMLTIVGILTFMSRMNFVLS